jgi:hypothetical protein
LQPDGDLAVGGEEGLDGDPNADVTGAGGFSEMVAAVHQQYPGYEFRLSSADATERARQGSVSKFSR